jgi:hypothetical protein
MDIIITGEFQFSGEDKAEPVTGLILIEPFLRAGSDPDDLTIRITATIEWARQNISLTTGRNKVIVIVLHGSDSAAREQLCSGIDGLLAGLGAQDMRIMVVQGSQVTCQTQNMTSQDAHSLCGSMGICDATIPQPPPPEPTPAFTITGVAVESCQDATGEFRLCVQGLRRR